MIDLFVLPCLDSVENYMVTEFYVFSLDKIPKNCLNVLRYRIYSQTQYKSFLYQTNQTSYLRPKASQDESGFTGRTR